MKRFALTVSFLAVSVSAFAGDVVGKYNGKLSIDFTAVKKMVLAKAAKGTADQKKQANDAVTMIDAQAKALNASVIKLELKKDGTLSMTQTTGGKNETETGKWTLKGNTIKLSGLSSKNGGPSELIGTVSKDGRSMFFDLTNEIKKQTAKSGMGANNVSGSLSFKRA